MSNSMTALPFVNQKDLVDDKLYIMVSGDKREIVKATYNDYHNQFKVFYMAWDIDYEIEPDAKFYGPLEIADIKLNGVGDE